MPKGKRIISYVIFGFSALGLNAFSQSPEGRKSPPVDKAQSENKTDRTRPFLVLDATLYKNKPGLGSYGIQPLHVIYGQYFWSDTKHMENLPLEPTVKQLARDAVSKAGQSGLTCIDIEHWLLRGEPQTVTQSITKYVQIARWFHEESPELKIGYYGNLPLRDYWRAIRGPNDKEYQEWQAENNRVMAIANDVDILFPSLYTFYPDQSGWEKYAIAQLREARRFNKPAYVFLWPQYHDSNRILRGSYISPDFWKLQLETAYKYADGIVIWGGWTDSGPAEWDENAPWWRVTKKFMNSLRPAIDRPGRAARRRAPPADSPPPALRAFRGSQRQII